MTYIKLPNRDGWCVEGYINGSKKCISKYYLVSDIKTKEDAKRQFLIDTDKSENTFEKIDVLECLL